MCLPYCVYGASVFKAIPDTPDSRTERRSALCDAIPRPWAIAESRRRSPLQAKPLWHDARVIHPLSLSNLGEFFASVFLLGNNVRTHLALGAGAAGCVNPDIFSNHRAFLR